MKTSRHTALRRILVPEAAKASANALVHLDSDHLKHLRKVLRMEWDEEVRVTDGAGRLIEGRLEKLGETGGVRLGQIVRTEPKTRDLELVICLPKNATMDWVVEKAVESGATKITPVVSSRSVVKVDPNEGGKYVRRWQTIMDGAVEQCERLWRPLIAEPLQWSHWLAEKNDALSFAFVSELRETQSEAEALTETWNKLREACSQRVRVLVGPEGGLSEQERADLTRHGFRELSLGSAVLRVETAVISALTLARVSCFVDQR